MGVTLMHAIVLNTIACIPIFGNVGLIASALEVKLISIMKIKYVTIQRSPEKDLKEYKIGDSKKSQIN